MRGRMRVWLAEFIGTFTLVFAGVGAAAAGVDTLGVALAFGFAVAVMVAAVGPISAAHFNPAVTVAFFVLGRIRPVDVFLYWSAQLVGATAAVLALGAGYGQRLGAVSFGVTRLNPDVGVLTGLGVEAVLGFFLVFVILSVVICKHDLDGLYIGLTVSVCALAGGAITGASMNPARSFGPALVSGMWADHWVYWLGPVVGAVPAALTARYLWANPDASANEARALPEAQDHPPEGRKAG